MSISTRENTFSVTIDITDVMLLAFIEVCERHHDVKPIDRGQHGIQYRFSYTSPSDRDYYGTLSLTFFSTTSRLLVQGSSYLLWVEEHLPLIQQQAHARCIEDMGTWRATARGHGIGICRNVRATRRIRQQHAAIDEANQDNDVLTQEEPGDHNEVACPDTYMEVAAVGPGNTTWPTAPPSWHGTWWGHRQRRSRIVIARNCSRWSATFKIAP